MSGGGFEDMLAPGDENGLDIHVECLEVLAHLGQAGECIDGAVEVGGGEFVNPDGKVEVVLDQLLGLIIAVKGAAEHSKQASQRATAANLTDVVRAITDGFAVCAENGILQGNDAHLGLELPTSGAHDQNLCLVRWQNVKGRSTKIVKIMPLFPMDSTVSLS
jgi:hypothetical protein